MQQADDARWMAAATALAERARPLSHPNPGVGAIIVRNGIVVGRGWTRDGGRPHAEAVALEQAGKAAQGATLYVTLEPCAHPSPRGPSCCDLVTGSGLARLVVGMQDPDARTAGAGIARAQASGIVVTELGIGAAELGLAGHMAAQMLGRPHVTLKLALSLDGCIATAAGESQWITGEVARAHTHRERARADAILVGGATLRNDNPALTVRLAGLEDRSPRKLVLTRGDAPDGWQAVNAPDAIVSLKDIRYLFIEGGAGAASAFLAADLVDRLLVYRAPIILGGQAAITDIGLPSLPAAHERWIHEDTRQLGKDTLEIYSRIR